MADGLPAAGGVNPAPVVTTPPAPVRLNASSLMHADNGDIVSPAPVAVVPPAPPAVKPGETAPAAVPPGEAPAVDPAAQPVPPVTPADPAREQRQRTAAARIGSLVAQKNQLQAENASLQAELARLRAPITFEGAQTPEQMAVLQARVAVRAETADDRAAKLAANQQQAGAVQAAVWQTKLDAAADRIPDLQQAVQTFTTIPLSDDACEFIAESDKSAELTYYLGRNPAVGLQIANLSPARQAAELARLEARVSAPAAKLTTTSPPPVPVLSGGAVPSGAFDENTASAAEVSAWFKKQYHS